MKIHHSIRYLLVLAGVLVAAAGAPGHVAARTHSKQGGALCGVLIFDHSEGSNTVYRGTGYGLATVVAPGEPTVCLNITPGSYWTLRANQGFCCGCC